MDDKSLFQVNISGIQNVDNINTNTINTGTNINTNTINTDTNINTNINTNKNTYQNNQNDSWNSDMLDQKIRIFGYTEDDDLSDIKVGLEEMQSQGVQAFNRAVLPKENAVPLPANIRLTGLQSKRQQKQERKVSKLSADDEGLAADIQKSVDHTQNTIQIVHGLVDQLSEKFQPSYQFLESFSVEQQRLESQEGSKYRKQLNFVGFTKEKLEEEIQRVGGLIVDLEAKMEAPVPQQDWMGKNWYEDGSFSRRYRDSQKYDYNKLKSYEAMLKARHEVTVRHEQELIAAENTLAVEKLAGDAMAQQATAAFRSLAGILTAEIENLKEQKQAQGDSETFTNMYNAVMEFKDILAKGQLNAAKEYTFMPAFVKMRSATSKYRNDKGGFKWSIRGWSRIGIAKRILKGIDDCLLACPEYIQDQFGTEMEDNAAASMCMDNANTKELYTKLAKQRFDKQMRIDLENGDIHEAKNVEDYVSADTFRMLAIRRNHRKEQDAWFRYLAKNGIQLPAALQRMEWVLFGEIHINHDGTFATEEDEVKAKQAVADMKKFYAANPTYYNPLLGNELQNLENGQNAGDVVDTTAIDKYLDQLLERMLSVSIGLEDLTAEPLKKNVKKYLEVAFLYSEFINLFPNSDIGKTYLKKHPKQIYDRIMACMDSNIYMDVIGSMSNTFNVDQSTGNPRITYMWLKKYSLQRAGEFANYVMNHPNHVGEEELPERDLEAPDDSDAFSPENLWINKFNNWESILRTNFIDKQYDENSAPKYNEARNVMAMTPTYQGKVAYLQESLGNPYITETSMQMVVQMDRFKTAEAVLLKSHAFRDGKVPSDIKALLKPVEVDIKGNVLEAYRENAAWNEKVCAQLKYGKENDVAKQLVADIEALAAKILRIDYTNITSRLEENVDDVIRAKRIGESWDLYSKFRSSRQYLDTLPKGKEEEIVAQTKLLIAYADYASIQLKFLYGIDLEREDFAQKRGNKMAVEGDRKSEEESKAAAFESEKKKVKEVLSAKKVD